MISFVVRGPLPLKNWKHRLRIVKTPKGDKPRRYNSTEYKDFLDRTAVAWAMSGAQRMNTGKLHCELAVYWQRQRHLGKVSVGMGDIDAVVECTLDALQHCRAIDDDVRIVGLTVWKHHDRQDPRVEVRLEQV